MKRLLCSGGLVTLIGVAILFRPQDTTSSPRPINVTNTRDAMHCVMDCIARYASRGSATQIADLDDVKRIVAIEFENCECTDATAVLVLRGRDAWGTPWKILPDSATHSWFVSAGPNKMFDEDTGTSDDLRLMIPTNVGSKELSD